MQEWVFTLRCSLSLTLAKGGVVHLTMVGNIVLEVEELGAYVNHSSKDS